MITRLLNLGGLNLGSEDDLVSKLKGNPRGHWENVEFLRINEELLVRLGGTWDNPPKLHPGWHFDPGLSDLCQQARAMIDREFSGTAIWGWKEPRTTILLPFWNHAISNLRFVICIRSPLEVANSLLGRNQMPIEKGIDLWSCYMRSAIRDSTGYPRIFTFYEDYFENPIYQIRRLFEFCGLEKPEQPEHLNQAIFHDLKHHSTETEELLADNRLAAGIKLFYIGLRGLALIENEAPVPAEERERRTSNDIGRLLELVEELNHEEEVPRLQMALAEIQTRVKQLHREIEQKESQLTQFRLTIQNLRQEVDLINTSMAWKVIKRVRRVNARIFPTGSLVRRFFDYIIKKVQCRNVRHARD